MKLKQKLAIRYIRARLNILSLVSASRAAEKAMELFCTPRERSGRALPVLFDEGEKLSFRLDGHTVRGHRWKPRGVWSGKRVLIAHGWQSSSRNFEQYIRALWDEGHEVLAFDAPAHGQSGGKKITLPVYVEMLSVIIGDHGPVDAMMGHSFGGLALSMLLGQRGASPGMRLVLVAPACEAGRAVDDFFGLLQLDERIRGPFDQLGMKLTGHDWAWFSIRRVMQSLTLPVLWLQDEEDDVTPPEDARQVERDGHSNIRFIFTKGLGHRKIYRDEEVMKTVIGFLTA